MIKNKESFILRLTGKKIHPFIIGVFVFILLMALLTLVFWLENIPITLSNYNSSLHFVLALAYMIFVTRVVHNVHVKSFHELLGHADLNAEEREDWSNRFFNFRTQWPETFGALALGTVHLGLQGYGRVFTGEYTYLLIQIWGASSILMAWFIISYSSSIFIRNMTLLNELSRKVKIDLLNMDKLMPLTKSGVWSTLGFIGVYTILFMNGISNIDWLNPAILILGPSIFWMIYTPLKGVRKRVVKEKERELSIIDAAIEGDHQALRESRIGANLDNINVIDLISYKRTIQSTFELPVNIPTASRFIFYLVIPLLTWIAASMVDKVVDYFLK